MKGQNKANTRRPLGALLCLNGTMCRLCAPLPKETLLSVCPTRKERHNELRMNFVPLYGSGTIGLKTIVPDGGGATALFSPVGGRHGFCSHLNGGERERAIREGRGRMACRLGSRHIALWEQTGLRMGSAQQIGQSPGILCKTMCI